MSTINYQEYTRLPVEVLKKADSMYDVLLVTTPHKKIVSIELYKVNSGIFSQIVLDKTL